MFTTLKKFFDFCNVEDRKKLYTAIDLGVVRAIFAALRISAIGVVIMGILDDNMSDNCKEICSILDAHSCSFAICEEKRQGKRHSPFVGECGRL